jgi:hypothetical protein
LSTLYLHLKNCGLPWRSKLGSEFGSKVLSSLAVFWLSSFRFLAVSGCLPWLFLVVCFPWRAPTCPNIVPTLGLDGSTLHALFGRSSPPMDSGTTILFVVTVHAFQPEQLTFDSVVILAQMCLQV